MSDLSYATGRQFVFSCLDPAHGNRNGVILLVGVLCRWVYSSFALEHKGTVGGVSKVGIGFLMAAVGASFGCSVMARLSLLISRIDFLFRD